MMCVQPSWITSIHPTHRLSNSDEQSHQNFKIASSNFVASDVNTTASCPQLHIVSTPKFTRHTQFQREISVDLSYNNGLITKPERICPQVNNKSSRRSLKQKSTSSKKQQTIKTLMKWIQISGKKANKRCKTVKNTTNAQKKQEIKRKPETLLELLSSKATVQSFRLFLMKEMSEENLQFWLEVESYKRQTAANQERLAPVIFATFVASGSTKEINIDCDVRKLTKESIQNPQPSSFDLAQSQIFKLMERDSFRRFLKSY